jgi:hypothetical protein
MPQPHSTTYSAIRTSVHRTPLSAAEAITQVHKIIEESSAFNHCFVVAECAEKISIQHLNQTGEVRIIHSAGVTFNFVSFEYRSSDFSFVRRLKQALIGPLQLSEPIKGSLGEPRMFQSLGKFVQFIPKFFHTGFIVTESAIESARRCEFDNYEDIIPEFEIFLKIRDNINGKKWDPEITPERINNYQMVRSDQRLILHRGVKVKLSRYFEIPCPHENATLRIYFKWDLKSKKHLIGWLERVRQS